MIYNYGLYNKIFMELLKTVPNGAIRNISDYNKLEQLVKVGDLVIIFNWGQGARKLQKIFLEKGINTFPNSDVSLLLSDKIRQDQYIKNMTQFNLERIYYKNESFNSITTPSLANSKKVVVKVGNEHQGKNKLLKNPNEKIRTKDNIIFEEFVENARSIRIAIIRDNPNDIFIIEQVNSKYALDNPETSWIKNINPDEYVYSYADRKQIGIKDIDKIIEDSLYIKRKLNHDYLGIDYVLNADKIGLLEVNDMIGLPDDERIYKSAISFFIDLVSKFVQ